MTSYSNFINRGAIPAIFDFYTDMYWSDTHCGDRFPLGPLWSYTMGYFGSGLVRSDIFLIVCSIWTHGGPMQLGLCAGSHCLYPRKRGSTDPSIAYHIPFTELCLPFCSVRLRSSILTTQYTPAYVSSAVCFYFYGDQSALTFSTWSFEAVHQNYRSQLLSQ